MTWIRIKSKKLFSNKFITLYDEKVIAPTGKKTDYGRVHFKKLAASVCVVDFIEKKFLLVGQFRYPLNQYTWETVQGGGDFDERPEEIAIRELSEEANLKTDLLNHICVTNTSNSVTDERAFLFWCDFKNTSILIPRNLDRTELIQTTWFSFEKCRSMLKNGEITDSLTQISLLYIFNNIL